MPPSKPPATSAPAVTKRSRRGFFLRGLAVVLPAMLTVFVFVSVGQFVDRYVAGPVNQAIYAGLESNSIGWTVLGWADIDPTETTFLLQRQDQPEPIREIWDAQGGPSEENFGDALAEHRASLPSFVRDLPQWGIDAENLRTVVQGRVGIWAGILIAASLILLVGYLASGFLGRALIAGTDRTLARLPLVRAVYPHAKQLVDFFLSDNEMEFDSVVAAPYPSPGIWSIGLVTGGGLPELNDGEKGEKRAVYIPSSPLPMTGYTVFIAAEDLIPLDMTVEEAFRLVLSVGVLVPDSHLKAGHAKALPGTGKAEGGPED
jgi:uncharacterized membrane protein